MADYTEKASLMIVDGSSAKINKINQALNTLQRTALRTQSVLSRLGGGKTAERISATAKAVNSLARSLNKLPKNTSIGVKLRGNSAAELRAMAKAMAQYKSASKNINTLIGAGGKGQNYNNLDILTQKLVRVARAANLAHIALGKVKANVPGRGGFNLPGNRNNNPPGMPRSIGLEIQPLKSFWRSAMVSLGHTIVSSIREGFATGTKELDVAANKMAQQKLPADVRNDFVRQSEERARLYPGFRPGQRQDLYAEIATNFQDPRDALKFDTQIDKAIAVARQQGVDVADAVQGLAALFRGLGQAGLLQNSDGSFNNDVGKYIDAYTAAKVSEGAQLNFNDVAQLLKYSKTAGQSLTPQEFFMQLLGAADVGASTQGVQLNQFIKNFAGETTKKAIQAQEAAGIREEGRLVKSGAVGKRTTYSYEAGKIKDENLLRENPSQWVAKYIMGPGGFLEKQGLNAGTATTDQINKALLSISPSSPSSIIGALDPLAGNRNVDDYLAKAVLQYQERYIKQQKFFPNGQLSLSEKDIQDINKSSSFVQLQDASSRLITLFGELGNRLEGPVLTGLGIVNSFLQSAIDKVQGKTPAQMEDYFALAAGGAGIGGAGFAAWKAAGWVSSGFGLPAAATALSTAAAQLSAAALSLGTGGTATAGASAAAAGAAGAGAGFFSKWGGRLVKGAGVVGAALTTAQILDWIDPKGNLWGLTSGIDKYVQDKLGVNPSNLSETQPKDTKTLIDEATQNSKLFGPQMSEQATQLTAWLNKLAEAKQRQTEFSAQGFGPSTDVGQNAAFDVALAEQKIAELQASITEGSDKILSAFDVSTAKLAEVSGQFGTGAADSLMGIAGPFGTAVGAAMRAAIGTIGVNVNQPAAPSNTGTNTNIQAGG